MGSHIAEAPEEQLGVRCLAQGSHLSRGIEGGREHWSFPTIPAGPSSYKPNSLTIRPQLPLYCLSYCWKGYLHGTPGYFYKYDNISMLHVQNVTWHQLFYHSYNSNTPTIFCKALQTLSNSHCLLYATSSSLNIDLTCSPLLLCIQSAWAATRVIWYVLPAHMLQTAPVDIQG